MLILISAFCNMFCLVVILLATTIIDILSIIPREISSSLEAEFRTTITFWASSLGVCSRLSCKDLHLLLASIASYLCSSTMNKFFCNEGISFITASQRKCLAPCRGIRLMTLSSYLLTFSFSVLISSVVSSLSLVMILSFRS